MRQKNKIASISRQFVRVGRRAASFIVCGCLAVVPGYAVANDFEAAIRPLLLEKCGDCHGPDTQEANLRLVERGVRFVQIYCGAETATKTWSATTATGGRSSTVEQARSFQT
jgi:hypothetical protein